MKDNFDFKSLALDATDPMLKANDIVAQITQTICSLQQRQLIGNSEASTRAVLDSYVEAGVLLSYEITQVQDCITCTLVPNMPLRQLHINATVFRSTNG